MARFRFARPLGCFCGVCFALVAAGCGSEPASSGANDGSSGDGGATAASGGGTSPSGSGGGGGAGGSAPAGECVPRIEDDNVHLAVGATLAPGEERTMCLRWTAPEDIDIVGFRGTLGKGGHHSLLLTQPDSKEPDGVAPCSEPEIMDATAASVFQVVAGVSYETDGKQLDFPSSPVQVGLVVPKGTQLVLDAHFVASGPDELDACATIDLARGKAVVAKLQFRTILPEEQYGLVVPAHGSLEVGYDVPAGARFRVAAASSHMHEGGTSFRLSVKETGAVIHETSEWAEPTPTLHDKAKLVVEEEQTLRLECSFENPGDEPQHFPDQMCVGAMYVLPCSFPGAC